MTFRGVLVPVLTPFKPDLSPDTEKFIALCKHLLKQGAAGLAVFGTTSEANSLSGAERKALLEALVEAGVPADKLMPGTGACSLTESADLTGHATQLGCGGVLLLPPFYYKGVSDEGIYDFVAEVIARVASDALKIYLYHIPPMAVTGYSLEVVHRLHDDFPDTVVGLKDSSGDWNHTAGLMHNFPTMAIFPGSEVFLLKGIRNGGAGCITATANVNLPMIRDLFDNWRADDANDRQEAVTAIRLKVQEAGPLIPALKAYVAHQTGDDDWAVVRPPLRKAGKGVAETLNQDLESLGFVYAAPAV